MIEETVQQCLGRHGLIGIPRIGAGNRRHGRGQLPDSPGVLLAVEDGLPAGLVAQITPGPDLDHGGAQFLLGENFQDEIGGLLPIAAIAAQVNAANRSIVQRRQQIEGDGRFQPKPLDNPLSQFGRFRILRPIVEQIR